MKAVNAELIQMYWSVGAYLSELCSASSFGDKIIDEVAAYIAQENPGVKGLNRHGLYPMKQFYETYKDDEFVTPLVTQISWTNHLLIMSGSKTAEERHFYMALCAFLTPVNVFSVLLSEAEAVTAVNVLRRAVSHITANIR